MSTETDTPSAPSPRIGNDTILNISVGLVGQFIIMYIMGLWVKNGAKVGYTRVCSSLVLRFLPYPLILCAFDDK
jgi:hypothetical protein